MHLLIVLAAFALVGVAPYLSPRPPNDFYQMEVNADEEVSEAAHDANDD